MSRSPVAPAPRRRSPASSTTTLLALLALLATGLLAARPAHAAAPASVSQPAKVDVLVAQVSTSGTDVDQRLQGMAKQFKKNGFAFTSYKLVRTSSLELNDNQTGTVALPNGKSAELTLMRREPDGKLRLRVAAAGGRSDVSMSPGGEAYIDAGPATGGKLFLLVRR